MTWSSPQDERNSEVPTYHLLQQPGGTHLRPLNERLKMSCGLGQEEESLRKDTRGGAQCETRQGSNREETRMNPKLLNDKGDAGPVSEPGGAHRFEGIDPCHAAGGGAWGERGTGGAALADRPANPEGGAEGETGGVWEGDSCDGIERIGGRVWTRIFLAESLPDGGTCRGVSG